MVSNREVNLSVTQDWAAPMGTISQDGVINKDSEKVDHYLFPVWPRIQDFLSSGTKVQAIKKAAPASNLG